MRPLTVRQMVFRTHPLQRERLKKALRLLLQSDSLEVSHASRSLRACVDVVPRAGRHD